jgi:hypothetical protein
MNQMGNPGDSGAGNFLWWSFGTVSWPIVKMQTDAKNRLSGPDAAQIHLNIRKINTRKKSALYCNPVGNTGKR